jgi:hypothetical protein
MEYFDYRTKVQINLTNYGGNEGKLKAYINNQIKSIEEEYPSGIELP